MSSFRKNAAELVREIETSHSVEDFKYHGIHIWPIVRAFYGRLIQDKVLSKGRYLDRFRLIDTSTKELFEKISRPHKSSVVHQDTPKETHNLLPSQPSEVGCELLFYARRLRHIHSAQNLRACYTDFLQSAFNDHKTKKIEELDSVNATVTARYINSEFFSTPWLGDREWFRRNCAAKYPDWPEKDKALSLIESIHDTHHKSINFEDLHFNLILFQAYLPIFDRLLRANTPSVIFVELYAEPTSFALCAVASMLNIPVVEVQHGLIGQYQWEYTHANKKRGLYEVTPKVIWCHDAATTETTKATAAAEHTNHVSVVGGNPFIEWSRENKETNTQKDLNFISFLENTDQPKILVALQYDDLFPQLILDLIDLAPKNWFWLLRLHPQTAVAHSVFESMLIGEGIENFDICRSTASGLGSLMPVVDHLITPYSTTSTEAKFFNLPVTTFGPMSEELMKIYIDKGEINHSDDPVLIVEALRAQFKKPMMREGTSNNTDKIHKALTEIMTLKKDGYFDTSQSYITRCSELITFTRKINNRCPTRTLEMQTSNSFTQKISNVVKRFVPAKHYLIAKKFKMLLQDVENRSKRSMK